MRASGDRKRVRCTRVLGPRLFRFNGITGYLLPFRICGSHAAGIGKEARPLPALLHRVAQPMERDQ